MNYYTADLHFGHKNCLVFDERPFDSVEEMDEALIENWNKKVGRADRVYILGDIKCGSKNPYSMYLERLNGDIHLILGNHDRKIVEDPAAMSLLAECTQQAFVKDNGREVFLSHYPCVSWPNRYHGSYHLYGHIHKGARDVAAIMERIPLAANVGCMLWNYEPVTLDEIIGKYSGSWAEWQPK